MRARWLDLKESLRSNFWFLPVMMVLLAILLYFVTIQLDRGGAAQTLESWGWTYTGGPDGASTLLSALAGSSITVAGVTFSLLIAALSLASSQFGPRLLRNFMRDWFNQFVLGIFSATFIYCLLVLRTVRNDPQATFVPELSVSVALTLALLSIGVLAIFIHHVALSMQAGTIVAVVSQDLQGSIDRLFPEMLGYEAPGEKAERPEQEVPSDFEQTARVVEAEGGGYLQVIDTDELLKIAIQHDLLLRLDCKPGDFIFKGMSLLRVWPAERLTGKLMDHLRDAFVLGRQRTPTQDVEADINQLVEMAVRALSPAINDPFTAMMCIDRLGEGLAHLARKPFPSLYRFDRAGQLRVITRANTFEQYVNTSFNQIRQYGSGSVSVTIRLLDMIATVLKLTDAPAQCQALYHQAKLVLEGSRNIPLPADQEKIKLHYHKVIETED